MQMVGDGAVDALPEMLQGCLRMPLKESLDKWDYASRIDWIIGRNRFKY